MEGAVDKQEPEAAQLVSNGAPAEAPVADTTKSDALEAGEVKTHSVPGRLPSRKDSAFQATAAVSVSLTFVDITYKVTLKAKAQQEKIILNNMNGYIKPGTFVAIMGPSGSGKTSLLNVLAGRVMKAGKSSLSGQVLINGKPRDEGFRRVSAYVMQDDVMFSCLTVWETLWVAARLRLPSTFNLQKKKELAESVIAELGLAKARNTPIGNEMIRGVSGGERKRTSIAVEMLSNPSLVFLDEPTSGLDSFQALNVMSCMADLAQGGRTVISTIHQPRSSIFALFQDLILLSEGRMVYFGKAEDSVGYFATRGFRCPEHYNPADYFMDMISLDRRDPELESASVERVKTITESFEASAYTRPGLHQKSMEEQALSGKGLDYDKFASGYLTQFGTLSQRAWWQATRDKLPIFIAYFQAIVMTVLISILYYQSNTGAQQIQNMQGAIFFICIFLAFNGVFQMITTFPFERNIINRERASNSYRVAAYYPAKALTEWPLRVGPTVFFVVVSYWPLHFQATAAKFFLTLAIAMLEFSAMNAVGLMIGAAAPTPQTALAFGPLITVLFMLFGGFYVNIDSIPVWIRWFRYLSPIQWGFVGLASNQFSGLTFSCAPGEPGCFQTGEEVLAYLNLTEFSVGVSLAAQAGLTLGYHTLAFLALLRNGPRMQPLSKLGGATVKPEKAVDTNELAGTDAAQPLAPASEKAAVDAPQPVA